MDTEREAQKLSHLPEVNERREAQAMKAAKARQAKNYVSYLELETGTTMSNHVFFCLNTKY